MENKELKENKIQNKYGIEYTKQGDYYMPNLMSISVASIGFVLPQNRQLTLKGEKSSPITPTL